MTIKFSAIGKLLLILLIFTLSSCATLLTRRNYRVHIFSNASNAKVQILDSNYNLPASIKIKRSKENLAILLSTDTSHTNFIVKSSPNLAFLYGNLLWIEFSPLAYGIDFTNQKRFYYGKTIFLDVDDTARVLRPPVSEFYHNYYTKTYPTEKGQINLMLSFPWINNFYLKPQFESTKSNSGFWGISTGIEYYYTHNKYLSLSAHAATDFFVPVPAAVDISGEYEMMSTIYLNLTDNFKLRRFTLGYGINFSENIWDFRYYDRFGPPPPSRDPVKRRSLSTGITLNAYHQFGEHFFMGMIYRPTFFTIKPEVDAKYEHLISLDFMWKVKLGNHDY